MLFHHRNKTYCDKHCKVDEQDYHPFPDLKKGFNLKVELTMGNNETSQKVEAIAHFIWGFIRDLGTLIMQITGLTMPIGGGEHRASRKSAG